MIECYKNERRYIVRHEKGDFNLSIYETGNSDFTAIFNYSEKPGGDDNSQTAVFAGKNLGDLLAEYNTWMRRCMSGSYRLKEVIDGEIK